MEKVASLPKLGFSELHDKPPQRHIGKSLLANFFLEQFFWQYFSAHIFYCKFFWSVFLWVVISSALASILQYYKKSLKKNLIIFSFVILISLLLYCVKGLDWIGTILRDIFIAQFGLQSSSHAFCKFTCISDWESWMQCFLVNFRILQL